MCLIQIRLNEFFDSMPLEVKLADVALRALSCSLSISIFSFFSFEADPCIIRKWVQMSSVYIFKSQINFNVSFFRGTDNGVMIQKRFRSLTSFSTRDQAWAVVFRSKNYSGSLDYVVLRSCISFNLVFKETTVGNHWSRHRHTVPLFFSLVQCSISVVNHSYVL